MFHFISDEFNAFRKRIEHNDEILHGRMSYEPLPPEPLPPDPLVPEPLVLPPVPLEPEPLPGLDVEPLASPLLLLPSPDLLRSSEQPRKRDTKESR